MKPLTKSRFKLGLECPNKLFFTDNLQYANKKIEDPFLEALAKGGFQVEALARLSYPIGRFVDAENWDYDKAVQITEDAFYKDKICLFEAGFAFENLFIRTDIIEKNGSQVKLIEVKAKSINPTDDYAFIGKKGGISSGWKPYLFDLAFQKFVAQKAFPDLIFTAYLMLADKTKPASVDGLNECFRIHKDSDPRKEIEMRVGSIEEIDESVLCEINVDDVIDEIIAGKHEYLHGYNFIDSIDFLKKHWLEKSYANWPVKHSPCKQCEFKANKEELDQGLLSGFEFCFTKQLNLRKVDFKKPTILEIWDCRDGKLLDSGLLMMDQLSPEDLKIKPEAGKISRTERQWLQVEKAVSGDRTPYILKDELKDEMHSWVYPLHFIDFETSAVALPFKKGRKPYEQTAFQFSHHTVSEDGTIEHKTEFINAIPGEFPNFEFVRALKDALGNDKGSVFRFADHENSIVNAIIPQLADSNELDKEELINFLRTISHSTKDSTEKWCGERDMIDLRKIVLNYYYNPLTNGSNSLKYILPAILNTSEFLKGKYSKPIGVINLSSKNFGDEHVWLHFENGKSINPYQLLPKLFSEWEVEKIDETISGLETVADGGAALTAYSKLQFTDMSSEERKELEKSLLKYCELDTLAMVMLFEHLKYDFLL